MVALLTALAGDRAVGLDETSGTPTPLPAASAPVVYGAKPPHMRGPREDGEVVLEVFADFQSAQCAELAELIEKLRMNFSKQMVIVDRQFAPETKGRAFQAALAAEGAAAQGLFWDMSKLLYQNQRAWSEVADVGPLFDEYAQKLGLNVPLFRQIADSAKARERILADVARGKSMGVTKTPALFVNDERVPDSALNFDELHRAVEWAMNGKHPLFPPKENKDNRSAPAKKIEAASRTRLDT